VPMPSPPSPIPEEPNAVGVRELGAKSESGATCLLLPTGLAGIAVLLLEARPRTETDS
jgi:hypothetical protein